MVTGTERGRSVVSLTMIVDRVRTALRSTRAIASIVVAAAIVAACGSDPGTTTAAGDAGTTASDTSCEEQQAAVAAAVVADLAADYEPAASPVQLANEYSDYVVRADSVVDLTIDEGRVTMTLADLTVLPVHETDLDQPAHDRVVDHRCRCRVA